MNNKHMPSGRIARRKVMKRLKKRRKKLIGFATVEPGISVVNPRGIITEVK